MEKALQDCCRSMRIGKILVDSDAETHEAKVIFAKFCLSYSFNSSVYHFKTIRQFLYTLVFQDPFQAQNTTFGHFLTNLAKKISGLKNTIWILFRARKQILAILFY